MALHTAPPIDAGGPAAGTTVLVVDDTESQRYAVARALRAEGFEVVEAANGRDALAAAASGTIDAVVLDVNLPDMDGLEVCRRLKAGTTSLLPVLHLSSERTSDDARARGLDAGADGYLTHPFDPNELRAAVSALVRLRRGELARGEQVAATSLLQNALDALPDQIALLGAGGEILAVNESWADFARQNGASGTLVGMNYCDVCDRASGPGAEEARAAAAGIRRVLSGDLPHYVQDYECSSPAEERWFRMAVRRVRRPGIVATIVTHSERTAEQLAARAEGDARRRAELEYRARAADEAFFRAITERSLEFVAIVDADGTFSYLSPAAARSLGHPVDALLGVNPLTLVHADDRGRLAATFRQLRERGPGAVDDIAFRISSPDGRWRWLEGAAQNQLHEAAVRGITCNARDVTARVEAENQRASSEARFRRFVETTAEGVVAMDIAGVITYANPRMEALLGETADALRGRSLFDFLTPEEAFAAKALLVTQWDDQALSLETQMRRADGTEFDARAAISQIVDDHGVMTGRLAMVSDITERARVDAAMAEALRAADLDRRRLGATLEAIPVGVALFDATGTLTHANPAEARIWGDVGPASAAGGGRRGWWPGTGRRVAPDEWPMARTLRDRTLIAGEVIEIERTDGTRAFVLKSSAPILDANGKLTGGVVVDVDVTAQQELAREREQLVGTLEAERRHLADVFEHAPSFLAVGRGPQHVFERVNPAYRALIGHRDVIGLTVAEALPEVVAQGIIEQLDRVRATGEPFVARQLPIQLARTPGGPLETRYINLVYQRLDQPDGDHALVAHGVDVTDHVLSTEQLLQSRRLLREQFAKLPVPTFLWERSGGEFSLLDYNDAAATLAGDERRDLRGRTLGEVLSGQDELEEDMARCLRDDRLVRRTIQVDLGATAGRRALELTMGPQQPSRVLVHAVDTTERGELEAQLRQAQKMDAVGRLAGGVAHDFNNLLTVIGAHSAFLLETLDPADPQYEDAAAIHKAGVRAAGLTRQLLAFSRKQILKPVVTDINAIVEETRAMLSRLLGEDIRIATELPAGLPSVVADPGQLGQVIVNLAVNARDAMPSGGLLTLRTRLLTVPEARHHAGFVPPGAYVALTVTDTGIGLTPEVKARLFEPFFTTKELGKGTGLGLATVYGIVKQSAGFITVDSEPGEGASFEVLLPALLHGEEAQQVHEAERASARGVETVLLVEDESSVRDVARRVLRRHGYVVLEAESGDAALELSRAFASVIHLVVTDAVMPGMGGAEVVKRLQAQRPGLRALVMSGYTDDEIVRRGIVSASLPFVQKPFTPGDFARAVREALDS